MAQEVFNAATDPKVFDQITAWACSPWAPLKVYGRSALRAVTERRDLRLRDRENTAPHGFVTMFMEVT